MMHTVQRSPSAVAMIDRVHFENFKSLQDVTIQLGRLTVLVGANGCGKSSVLQGIDSLLARLREGDRPPELVRGLTYRGQASKMRLIAWDEKDVSVELEITFDAHRATHHFAKPALPNKLSPATYLHLDANQMSRTSVIENEVPHIEPTGHGLATMLAWMKGAAEDDLAQITADLRRVVAGVKRIRTYRERIAHRRIEKLDVDGQPVWRPVDETQIGDRFTIEFDDGSEIPGHLLSEGTVLALGLLTKLRGPERPKLLLIDDVDRGLHLGAQVNLIRVLRELIEIDPYLQIVCTSHSPYLLDLFEAGEVRVLALDAERRTHVRLLTEHPDFDKWKFGTQTGELWAALGEDWVVSGAEE